MTRRFIGTRRVRLTGEAGSVDAYVAEGFRLRLVGLARLRPGEIEPLLFPRCRSIHTFGMTTAIDVVWLDLGEAGEGAAVLGLASVGPRRVMRAPRGAAPRKRVAALELGEGEADALGLGVGRKLSLESGR